MHTFNDILILQEDASIAELVHQELLAVTEAAVIHRASAMTHETIDIHSPAATNQLCFLAIDRVRTDHLRLLDHLRSSAERTVVVVSQDTNSDAMLDLFRSGADDVLVNHPGIRDDLAKLLTRLSASSSRRVRVGRIVSVLPSSDASDANLLATNLAAVMANDAGSCALIDLHLRGGDLAAMLQCTPPHTLYDLLTQQDGIDDAMIEQAITRHQSGIHLLASPPLFSDLTNINTHLCGLLLQYTNRICPFTIINVDHAGYGEQLRAILASETVLITTQLNVIAIAHAQRMIHFLREQGVDLSNIAVAALRSGRNGELPLKSVQRVLKTDRMHAIPDDPTSILISLNVGNPLVLETPGSPTTASIQKLAGELFGRPATAPSRGPTLVDTARGLVGKLTQSLTASRTHFGNLTNH